MICRRIAGPLVGQESRLRVMLSIASENIMLEGGMQCRLFHNQGDGFTATVLGIILPDRIELERQARTDKRDLITV